MGGWWLIKKHKNNNIPTPYKKIIVKVQVIQPSSEKKQQYITNQFCSIGLKFILTKRDKKIDVNKTIIKNCSIETNGLCGVVYSHAYEYKTLVHKQPWNLIGLYFFFFVYVVYFVMSVFVWLLNRLCLFKSLFYNILISSVYIFNALIKLISTVSK